jgi:hypothetical protein
MKSHSRSRLSPLPAACRSQRRSAPPSAAITMSASQLRRDGSLTPSAEEALPPDHQSQIRNHRSPTPHFLIASRQLLEICLSSSQQTRKLFLISSFSAFLAHSRHLVRAVPRSRRRILEASPSRPATPVGWQARDQRARCRSPRLRMHRTSAKLGPCENYQQ